MPQPVAPQLAEPFGTDGQAVSQLWQWAGSLAVSTHEPPQFVVPAGQLLVHLPSLHASLVAHGLSQPPQLAGLLLVSTQAEPHSAKPCSQLAAHAPSTQMAMPLAGASQACPHLPQFWASVAKSAQAEPHRSKPASHLKPHSLAAQVAAPLRGMGHAMPQALQLSGLEVTSMHEPLQLVRPPLQPTVHLPLSQT
jgi:hypothetical protein